MCELLHTSAVVQKMQGGLELAINSRVGGRGKLAERIDWSEASSNIRAVWHSDELVVWNRPIAPGVHGSSAHLAVPRMPIAGRGLVIGDFIQRPTMGALEGLSHPPSIGAIVLFVLPVGSGKSIRLPPAATNSSRSVGTCLSKGANGCPLLV